VKDWVGSMVRDLVDRPDSVEVREVEEDGVTIYEVVVDSREMGRVIGRQGRTVQALRTLLSVAGARDGRDYELEILE
jgi:predicted RNA-binding protein YlqC (UPF0109 family)